MCEIDCAYYMDNGDCELRGGPCPVPDGFMCGEPMEDAYDMSDGLPGYNGEELD